MNIVCNLDNKDEFDIALKRALRRISLQIEDTIDIVPVDKEYTILLEKLTVAVDIMDSAILLISQNYDYEHYHH